MEEILDTHIDDSPDHDDPSVEVFLTPLATNEEWSSDSHHEDEEESISNERTSHLPHRVSTRSHMA